MYNNVQENLFEGLLTAALNEFVAEELALTPSDEELAKTYPTSQKMLKYYRRKAKEKKLNSPLPLVYLKRVAVILLITVSVSFGILMTSEDVRAAVTETVVTWYEKYVQIDFSKANEQNNTDKDSETTDSIPDISELEVMYIPSEFMLTDTVEKSGRREYIYISENGEYLIVGIYSPEDMELAVDIEQMEYEQISINGNDGYLFYNEIERTGYLTYANEKYAVVITSISSKEDLIKVAENIK